MFNKSNDISILEKVNLKGQVDIGLYIKEDVKEQDVFSCFFVKFSSQEQLNNLWMEIVTYIGTEYISQLDNDFSIWNVYVVFSIEGDMDKDTKYLIENNKLFLRKIVLETDHSYSDQEIINYLNSKVLGVDIKVTEHKEIDIDRKYSATTFDLLKTIDDVSNTEIAKTQRDEWIESLLRSKL
ncbi:ABC-three component system middle component 1 [Vibrio sp. 10N.222.51.C12]|uniref:ABC-three component system middle component 1 n=1 Tax=unclassified Vibrio TaxID=2614977 RepID=UPI000C8277A8|nr:ABC-three component system middle component 1 [Vibrio sp. 10N.286.48.B7]PMH80373.1 hypothetical protein BCU58_23755 [Vibrio sp. 10N.286.48.B7]